MPSDKTGHFYYPRYPTIWASKTSHLTLAEDGAYHRLIDHYMLTRAPLPTDDRSLARILGVGLDEWLAVKAAVVSFFKVEDGRLIHTFCNTILEDDSARIVRARLNGKNGGRPASTSKDKETTQSVTKVNPVGSPNTKQHNTTLPNTFGSAPGDFEEFWAAWRPFDMDKGSKQKARQSYDRARKTTDHPAIIAGAKKYLDYCHRKNQRTQHVVTWINQQRWGDEYPEAQKSASGSPYSKQNPQVIF